MRRQVNNETKTGSQREGWNWQIGDGATRQCAVHIAMTCSLTFYFILFFSRLFYTLAKCVLLYFKAINCDCTLAPFVWYGRTDTHTRLCQRKTSYFIHCTYHFHFVNEIIRLKPWNTSNKNQTAMLDARKIVQQKFNYTEKVSRHTRKYMKVILKKEDNNSFYICTAHRHHHTVRSLLVFFVCWKFFGKCENEMSQMGFPVRLKRIYIAYTVWICVYLESFMTVQSEFCKLHT